MQIVNIAGMLGKDAVFKTTQGGNQLCNFTVAVNTGYGDNKTVTWWDVTKWGKGTDKLAEMLAKGTKVSVSGEVSTREHEGKTYLQIRADHVTLQGGRGEKHNDLTHRNQDGFGGSQRPSPLDYGSLDDEIPF